jgi:hypothetical protein
MSFPTPVHIQNLRDILKLNGRRAVSSFPELVVARVEHCRCHIRFRHAGYDAIDRICAYYDSIRDKPVVAQVKPGYLRALIPGMFWPDECKGRAQVVSCFCPRVGAAKWA